MPPRTTHLRFFTFWFLAMLGTFMVGIPQSSFALDPLPRSPRVGSLRTPLLSYNRVPISALLSDSASYHLREIRIAGIVRTVETQLMTRGCGKPYELTMLSLEDDSGVVDVIDQGACGKNTGVVRAPTLAAGDRVELLVHVIGKTDRPGSPPEIFTLWIERAHE
jgi:hypothetical protein